MNSKQGALYVFLVLGGIGVLAVSCTDSDDDHIATHNASDNKTETHDKPHSAHWSYEGDGAPFLWSELNPDYALCSSGKNQSPIDISTVNITDLPQIEYHYQTVPLEITNNGHTIQVNYAPGSYINVMDKRYDLLQFHFHAPSEHTFGGKAYDMVAHLVHKAEDGQLGVIAVLFEAGDHANDNIATLWQHMPETSGTATVADDVMINAADLLPRYFTYFNYTGSLTTPPCSENVNWMVLATPNTLSSDQVKQFTRLFPLSTRPVNPLNGRAVNISN